MRSGTNGFAAYAYLWSILRTIKGPLVHRGELPVKMPGNSHIFGLIVSHMGQNGQGMVCNGEFRERESCGRSQQVVLLDECSDFRKTVNPISFLTPINVVVRSGFIIETSPPLLPTAKECGILMQSIKALVEISGQGVFVIRCASSEGGAACLSSRGEPSRCSSPTWRGLLVCFSSWVSATPTCWRSTATSCAQHSSGGTGTSWTRRETPSSWRLLAPPMPREGQWQHNVPSPPMSGPKEWSCVSGWVSTPANQRLPPRATRVWTCITPHAS